MKTISIRQPMASQIIFGLKKSEFRSWNTDFRGRVAIHASGNIDYDLPCDESTPLLIDISQNLRKMTMERDGKLAKICTGFELEWNIFIRAYDYRAENERPLCPCSAILGSVEIYDCVQRGEKDFEWSLCEPRALEHPLLFVKGKLNFWEFSPPPGITI